MAPVLQAVGPPDLLVRTSGEARLSNFLLWETAYAELVFREETWPDFKEGQLREVLVEYGDRARRFGGRPSSSPSQSLPSSNGGGTGPLRGINAAQ